MHYHKILLLTSAAAAAQFGLAGAALAQGQAPSQVQTAPEDVAAPDTGSDGELESSDNEIVVTAARLRGQLDVPQPPVAELSEDDIAAYGTGSLADLLGAIAPQTGSGRGRGGGGPVVLLNGQRVSGFREMRNIPPEAIRKVEILPEEVALRFGYSANQRVVNFILKDNFSSKTVEAEYAAPSAGGFHESEIEGTLFRIDGKSRTNLAATLKNGSPLTEAERDIVQSAGTLSTVPGDPDAAAFRSLIADTRSAAANGTWSTGLGQSGQTSVSLNGAIEKSHSTNLAGLNTVVLTGPSGATATRTALTPLARSSETLTVQAGAALNTRLGDWQLAATADASHGVTDSRTDNRANLSQLQALAASGALALDAALPTAAIVPVAPDTARSISNGASSLLTLIGQPVRLPAGDVSLTAKAGFGYSAIRSSGTRNAGLVTDLSRSDFSTGINVGIPVASRRKDFLSAIGDLTLNLNAGVNHLSDFGTLVDYGAGLTWGPTEKLSVQVSYLANEAAPGLSDLGGATLVSYNVPLYDFARNETVLATLTSGGNSLLKKETQRDWKLGLNWELPFLRNSNFVAEYFSNRSNDVTAGFPLLTPAIEAAFPGRVTRDASGRLTAIDQRPVTFFEEKSSRLRYGFNVSGNLGKPDPAAAQRGPGGMRGMMGGGGGGGGRPGGGSGGRGPGGGMGGGMMGGGSGQGRWNLALYHTVRFDQTVQIAPGGPVLDLLSGDAISGGGVARHALELEGGGFYRGFGLRVSGNYTGPTHVNGSGLPGSSDLSFDGLAKLNLRAFADLNQRKSLIESMPFLKNSRISFSVNNLFDARQTVTDETGTVPLRYQPDLLDPRGRMLEIEFRKMF